MLGSLIAAAGLLLSLAPSSAQAASRLTPPVLPLVVRNPYLSLWQVNARNEPWNDWPMFYTGTHIGLSVLASSPDSGTIYPLFGRPQDSLRPDDDYSIEFPTYLGASYDASITNYTYLIPGVSGSSTELKLSFLSPITPTSTLRQSIPASYLTVYVKGNASLDVYIDLNGQWVSGDRGRQIVWDFSETPIDGKHPTLKSWTWKQRDELLFTEHGDQAEWGSLHFSAPGDVRHECGTSSLLRQRFAKTSTLQNAIDNEFRGIMEDEPVFAFSKSFDLNKTTSSGNHSVIEDSTVFTIAHIQDPVVQFASARGLTMMRPLWASYFADVTKLLTFHYLDFYNAFTLAQQYSDQLAVDAYKSGADDYVDIVALSARQVMGATVFSGTPDDPILFMKEISSNGNFQTIDVIFPAFPFFLYTNPKWMAYLLEPLIEHMLSGQYPNTYAMHDLGTHFPNATGHPDGNDEYMPVEECGNILMMGLALANSLQYESEAEAQSSFTATGVESPISDNDGKLFPLAFTKDDKMLFIDDKWGGGAKGKKQAQQWVEHSYKLWKQWTGYLVEFSLEPANQLSTDDFAGWLALQTGLALKGIIGIRAMAGLSELIGEKEDFKYYLNVSKTYVAKWEEYGISRDKTHAKLAYDWYGSWTTLYNLFGDALLCFHLETPSKNSEFLIGDHGHGGQKPIGDAPDSSAEGGFVPRHIYKMQSDWYHYVRQKYGVPLDNRRLFTKTDWEFFSMAITSRDTRDEVLESVAKWLNETNTDRPFTDLHRTEGEGGFPGPNFFARPVIGGHFAFLALSRACGGKATDGLKYLDDASLGSIDVESVLEAEKTFGASINGDFRREL